MLRFIVGAVVGGLVVWAWMRRNMGMDPRLRGDDRGEREKGEIINPEQVEKRKENLEKVLDLFKDHPQMTNEIVTGALGVSDATAVRYFDELEKQGRIEQVGKTGQNVSYRLK